MNIFKIIHFHGKRLHHHTRHHAKRIHRHIQHHHKKVMSHCQELITHTYFYPIIGVSLFLSAIVTITSYAFQHPSNILEQYCSYDSMTDEYLYCGEYETLRQNITKKSADAFEHFAKKSRQEQYLALLHIRHAIKHLQSRKDISDKKKFILAYLHHCTKQQILKLTHQDIYNTPLIIRKNQTYQSGYQRGYQGGKNATGQQKQTFLLTNMTGRSIIIDTLGFHTSSGAHNVCKGIVLKVGENYHAGGQNEDGVYIGKPYAKIKPYKTIAIAVVGSQKNCSLPPLHIKTSHSTFRYGENTLQEEEITFISGY